jgi:hypothetical protein
MEARQKNKEEEQKEVEDEELKTKLSHVHEADHISGCGMSDLVQAMRDPHTSTSRAAQKKEQGLPADCKKVQHRSTHNRLRQFVLLN